MLETLDEVRNDLASRLTVAAQDRRSQMHTAYVATANADVRTMVLRAFDPVTWTLRFHTDTRAPKVAVIENDPRIGVLLYDKPGKLQLRLTGTGEVLRGGPVADAAWAESNNFARRCYLGEGPGASSDAPTSGLPEQFEGSEPDDEALRPARANFAVLLVKLASLDWFTLAHTGHRRARFERQGDGWQGHWVAP